MSENTQTILYNGYQIEISAEPTGSDNQWKPVWWIWVSDEPVMFSAEDTFATKISALAFAENSARLYVEKLIAT